MMMRKNNNQNRNNNMKHRNNNGGGQRRYPNNGGGHSGGNRAPHDAGNIQRQKHHATQQLGKYGDLARNAQINGDRVDVEYYLQHVEHYTRVLTDIAAIEAERYAHQREQQIVPGGPNDPNAQQHESQGNAPQESQGESPVASEGQEPASGEAAQSQPQPRPRQPRRQYNNPSAATDNGAKEANSNTNDIPLPDSILPPI